MQCRVQASVVCWGLQGVRPFIAVCCHSKTGPDALVQQCQSERVREICHMLAGYVPSDAPGCSSYFTPRAAREASTMAMQHPVIAKLDIALTKYAHAATHDHTGPVYMCLLLYRTVQDALRV